MGCITKSIPLFLFCPLCFFFANSTAFFTISELLRVNKSFSASSTLTTFLITAAILHDTVEDTSATLSEIEKEFSKEVA